VQFTEPSEKQRKISMLQGFSAGLSTGLVDIFSLELGCSSLQRELESGQALHHG
jgi:hypothetical protein